MSSMQHDNRPRENGINQRPDEVVDPNNRVNSQSVVQGSLQSLDSKAGSHVSSTGLDARVSPDSGVSAASVKEHAMRDADSALNQLAASAPLSAKTVSEYRMQIESEISLKASRIDAMKDQQTREKNRPSETVAQERENGAEKGATLSSEKKDSVVQVALDLAADKERTIQRELKPTTIAPVGGIFLESARAPAEQVEKAIAKVLQAHEKKGREAESFLEKLQAAGQKVDAMGVPVMSASFQVERNKRGELVDL
jgi:hypothetical protein